MPQNQTSPLERPLGTTNAQDKNAASAPQLAWLPTVVLLSRPAHVPTVFSNCLAGWWLAGGGNPSDITVALCGALLVFLGGAALNDAFDVRYDRRHRRIRPIPARKIGLRAVWRTGLFLLLAGVLALQWPGRQTAGVAMLLGLCVILHNSLHRLVFFSPLLLGCCRLLLYLIGASASAAGINGWAIWCGLAVASYSVGVELMHAAEARSRPYLGAAVLLLMPALLAAIMNRGLYAIPAAILGAAFVLWTAWAIRGFFRQSNAGFSRSALMPGIVLADMLAACVTRSLPWHAPGEVKDLTAIFLSLFLGTIALCYLERESERRARAALVTC